MITKEFLDEIVKWQRAEGKRRSVDIHIEEGIEAHGFRIWFYDYDLQFGSHCDDHIPDLGALVKEGERKEYEKLKAKFDKEEGDE